MLDEALTFQSPNDDKVSDLLLSRAAEAHRLAAWILRDPVGAEDVVQEAALIAWRRRSTLRDAASAEAWFNRIVINACRERSGAGPARRRLAMPPGARLRSVAVTFAGAWGYSSAGRAPAWHAGGPGFESL